MSTSGMSQEQITLLLKRNQQAVIALLIAQLSLDVLWVLATLVPGFALYDGAVGSVSAYTHVGWWLVIELLVLLCGSVATYFGLHYSTTDRRVEKGVAPTSNWLTLYLFVLFIGFCSHVVHDALTWVEVAGCTSTLCRNYYWAHVCTGVLLILLAIVTVLLMWRARIYQNTLDFAMLNGVDMTVGGGPGGPAGSAATTAGGAEDVENGNGAKTVNSAATPLLAAVSSRHGAATKIFHKFKQ
jgi:hypothetical protein